MENEDTELLLLDKVGRINSVKHVAKVDRIDFAHSSHIIENEKFPKSVWFIIGNEFCERYAAA